MTQFVEPLVLDLCQSLSDAPRPFNDVMDAWSCAAPRVLAWDSALERGLIVRGLMPNGEAIIRLTEDGRDLISRSDGFIPAAASV
ncbi:hypothetical protein [Acuticoccus kandeliae]|uniref:hypothetical protein n=1 Tax=Acuticoccus kandeliae TaxID=2073160 RepID=UPI000D3E1B69|nr:hypothetical protein [Acuticoccus kandeliae]